MNAIPRSSRGRRWTLGVCAASAAVLAGCGGGGETSSADTAGTVEALSAKKRVVLVVSQIRTLSVERIGRRLARATAEEVARVVEGLNEIVGA